MVKGRNDGFKFENEVFHIFDGKYPRELSDEYRNILSLSDLGFKDDIKMTCDDSEGQGLEKKRDLMIKQNDKIIIRASIKSGTGNSMHQESLSSFEAFLENLGCDSAHIRELRFFQYGDGSYDGLISENDYDKRMNSNKICKDYPSVIQTINSMFYKYNEKILERIFYGHKNYLYPTILIYKKDGCVSATKIDSLIMKNLKVNSFEFKSPSCGNLKYQNCNRCLSGQEKSGRKKRTEIQFKYSSLDKDI